MVQKKFKKTRLFSVVPKKKKMKSPYNRIIFVYMLEYFYIFFRKTYGRTLSKSEMKCSYCLFYGICICIFSH